MRRLAVSVLLSPLLMLPAPARADLTSAEPAAQLGELRAGMPLTHRFTFRNAGLADIEITDLRASCGCLKPQLASRRYRPGEEGSLVVEVNSLAQPAGPHQWRVVLAYREGNQERELALYVAAVIISELQLQPASLTLYTDAAVSHELTLIEKRPLPLTVTSFQTTSPHLRVRLGQPHQDADANWTRTIQVEAAEGMPEGRHEEIVQLFTDDPEYRELKVPVSIVKRPRRPVSAAPSTVTIAGDARQPVPSRIVLLSGQDDQEVLVKEVVADDPAIQCHWARGPGPRTTLKILIDPGLVKPGTLQSAVHVRLLKPADEQLSIPVTCTVR
jgi:hypothetical protein